MCIVAAGNAASRTFVVCRLFACVGFWLCAARSAAVSTAGRGAVFSCLSGRLLVHRTEPVGTTEIAVLGQVFRFRETPKVTVVRQIVGLWESGPKLSQVIPPVLLHGLLTQAPVVDGCPQAQRDQSVVPVLGTAARAEEGDQETVSDLGSAGSATSAPEGKAPVANGHLPACAGDSQPAGEEPPSQACQALTASSGLGKSTPTGTSTEALTLEAHSTGGCNMYSIMRTVRLCETERLFSFLFIFAIGCQKLSSPT